VDPVILSVLGTLMNELPAVLPGVAATMLGYLLQALSKPSLAAVVSTGLPAEAFACADRCLIVAATPIIEQMFDKALLRTVAKRSCHVVLIRHGLHPEELDPVRIDVAAHTPAGPMLLRNLSFYRHYNASLHLVPDDAGISIAVTAMGLIFRRMPPWLDDEERSDGLVRAAGEIIRARRKHLR
jgi:hypothetical protein